MGNKYNEKHGLYKAKEAMKTFGSRAIDGRTSLSKALLHWKEGIIEDLGGKEVVSNQQLTIIDLAVSTRLIVSSLDSWILTQKSLVLHRKRAVIPIIMQRQQLADSLANYMVRLGLGRKSRHASLQTFIEEIPDGEAAS